MTDTRQWWCLILAILVAAAAATKTPPLITLVTKTQKSEQTFPTENVRTRIPLYERSLPTWTVMGMPLIINSDTDVDLKIMEKQDVDKAGCFRWCDVDNKAVGYRNGAVTSGQTRHELHDAGVPFQRQSSLLQPCTGELAFVIVACAFDTHQQRGR